MKAQYYGHFSEEKKSLCLTTHMVSCWMNEESVDHLFQLVNLHSDASNRLYGLWFQFKGPCSMGECHLCNSLGDLAGQICYSFGNKYGEFGGIWDGIH